MNRQNQLGAIRINVGGGAPGKGNLPYPNQRIVAVLPSEAAVPETVECLRSAGTADEDVDLFFGDEGTAWFHTFHHRRGLRGRIWQLLSLGDEQQQSREYEQAMQGGHVVLVVRVPRDSAVPAVQAVLEQAGGTNLRYFTRWTVQDLVVR